MSEPQFPDQGERQSTGYRRRARRPGRGRLVAPLAIALAVVLVLGGAAAAFTLVGTGSSGGHNPGKQAANSGTQGGGAGSVAPSGGVLHLESVVLAGPVYGPLRLEGTLPTSGPRHGNSYALPGGRAPEQLVRQLASALGLSAPRHVTGAWIASGEGTLRVADAPGWPWTYSSARTIGGGIPGCAETHQNHPRASVMTCPVVPTRPAPSTARGVPVPRPTSSGGSSVQPSPVPARALPAAVHDVLAALGEQDATVVAGGAGQYVTVAARRQVAGLPVAGFDTNLVVISNRVSSASGWLAGGAGPLPSERSWALIGAREAYQRAAHAPTGMRPNLCRLRSGASIAECVGSEPRKVTGAVFGLGLARTTDGGALLVPAWLFGLAGDGGALARYQPQEPLAVVAIAGDHLQAPSRQPAPLRGSVG